MKERFTGALLLGCALSAVLAAGVAAPQNAAGAVTAHTATAAACAPSLEKLSLSPASVPAGAPATATVTLTCDAPKAETVSLKGFSGISVPASIRVAAGKNAASATIRTGTSKTARHGTIAATLGKVRKTTTLTLTPTPKTCATPVLSSVSLPSLSYVGEHPELTVKLNCAAAGTVKLSLKSTSTYLPVPALVSIDKYYSTAVISLTPKADEIGQFKSTVSVHLGSRTDTRSITVDPGLASVSIPPVSNSPDAVVFDVLITGQAPAGGVTVKISSSSDVVTMPASISIQQDGLGAVFNATSVQAVAANTMVTLSATYGGRTLSAAVTLVPPWTSGDKMTITAENGPGAIYGLDSDLEYFVNLSNPAGSNGLNVSVTTSDPDVVQLQSVPALVPPGWDQGAFEINVADVTAPVHPTITATADGVTTTLKLTIEPRITTVTVPSTIVGGQSATGTVSLAGDVDTPTTVDLLAVTSALTVPLSVTIPAGASSADFTISSVPTTSDSQDSIVASLGTMTIQSANIDVTP